MKNLLVLFLIGIGLTAFGQGKTKKVSKEMEKATGVERFFVCYTMEDAKSVCQTINSCPGNTYTPTGAKLGYTVTSCNKVKVTTQSMIADRAILKNPKSVAQAPNSRMVHCKQLADGSLTDCYEEPGTCSAFTWKKGYVCKGLKVEKAEGHQNNQN